MVKRSCDEMDSAFLTSNSHDILVIIPAFNEGKSISGVIDDVKEYLPEADILVVNDGSTDKTGEIARFKGVFVVEHASNLGIGSTVQTGLKFARNKGYSIAIQVDGDGQHAPEDLHRLLEPILINKADLSIGSRFLGAGAFKSTIPRRIGIFFFSCLIYVITKRWISDPTSGFRAMNKSLIYLFSERYPEDYPEPEALITAYKSDMRICEVPVSMKPRRNGISSISFFSSIYYILKVSYAIILEVTRKREIKWAWK